jgi:hypothetical protein
MDLRSRVAAALRSRLAPHSGVARKQFASAMRRSPSTIQAWLEGRADIKAKDVDLAAKFLKDLTLIEDIYGKLGEDSRQRVAAWFIETGGSIQIGTGAADAARVYLRFPQHAAGDMAAYARRNLGWIDCQSAGDGHIAIGYDDRGISLNAARAASDWLLEHRQQIDQVTRRIAVHGRIVERVDKDAEVAAMAIMRAAEIANLPQRVPWKVERLSPESLPEFRQILKAWDQNHATIVEAAAALGLAPDCSLLRVSGTDVETLAIGSAVELPYKEQFVGRNVLAAPDLAYREMVRWRMIKAAQEGFTVCRCNGSIIDAPRSYYSIACSAGPDTGIVLVYPLLMPSTDAADDPQTLPGHD